jgi:hypothetical protein
VALLPLALEVIRSDIAETARKIARQTSVAISASPGEVATTRSAFLSTRARAVVDPVDVGRRVGAEEDAAWRRISPEATTTAAVATNLSLI